MPLADPTLRRLRIRTGIKPGRWAELVDMHRTAYTAVESGRRPGSAELFSRCAAQLTDLLGEEIEPEDLMADSPHDPKEPCVPKPPSKPPAERAPKPDRPRPTGPNRDSDAIRAAS